MLTDPVHPIHPAKSVRALPCGNGGQLYAQLTSAVSFDGTIYSDRMKKSEALKILGLTDGASDEAIKKAHREKVRENHPDQFAQNSAKHAEAEERMKLVNEARDVLLSRKWDPEFDPRRAASGQNPYATPYGGASYGRPASQGGQGDPFADWPFAGGWVWTSWDNIGTNPNGQSQRPGADPFNPFDPFSAYASPVTKTPKEVKEEAEAELKSEALTVGVKLALVALLAAVGNVATGMFLYILGSVFAYFRKSGGCSWILIVPLLLFFGPWLFVLMPRAGAPVSLGMLLFFLFALYADGKQLYQSWQAYSAAKKNA